MDCLLVGLTASRWPGCNGCRYGSQLAGRVVKSQQLDRGSAVASEVVDNYI